MLSRKSQVPLSLNWPYPLNKLIQHTPDTETLLGPTVGHQEDFKRILIYGQFKPSLLDCSSRMAASFHSHALLAENPLKKLPSLGFIGQPLRSSVIPYNDKRGKNNKRFLTVVAAAGELSADSTTYLIAGAAAVALIGTAFPVLFSRKDLCPECDGAGFVRKSAATLRANAARKDLPQIVCPTCNGLGKLNQIDK